MALLSPFQLPKEPLISSLCAQYPCREQQIRSLVTLLSPHIDSPKNIVLYGLEAAGKSSIAASLLSALQSSTGNSTNAEKGTDGSIGRSLRFAVVKSAECITGRHLLETAVNAIADAVGRKGRVTRCENLAQLAVTISHLLEDLNLNSVDNRVGGQITGKFVLVFDGIDRQRDPPPTLLPALARMGEIIAGLTVIFIVTSPRPHFLHTPGSPQIHFHAYNKAEAVQILALTPPSLQERTGSPLNPEDEERSSKETKDIWVRFCSAVWDTLSKHSGRDILSFRETCSRLWPSFTAPLRDGSFTAKDFSRLLVSKRHLLQDEQVLVPSIVANASQSVQTVATTDPKLRTHQTASIAAQLPLFSRLLLISAYLASYTPARNDQLLFMKLHSNARRKKGGGTAKGRPRASKHRKISGKLLGPQAFAMERLLAIFHAIRIDAGGSVGWSSTADIPMAIATLTSLRLVIRTSAVADTLDASTKWKVNIGWDVVRGMARSVCVEVEDFLID